MKQTVHLSWETPEYVHKERGSDWYWALAIITVSAAVASFLLGNILFAIFIVIGTFTIALYSVRDPQTIRVSVTDAGIIVHKTLYPFDSLKSFWVSKETEPPHISLESQKRFAPYITIPIRRVDAETVRDILGNFLEEREHRESLAHTFAEYLGF